MFWVEKRVYNTFKWLVAVARQYTKRAANAPDSSRPEHYRAQDSVYNRERDREKKRDEKREIGREREREITVKVYNSERETEREK